MFNIHLHVLNVEASYSEKETEAGETNNISQAPL